jgi:hypothetical protein
MGFLKNMLAHQMLKRQMKDVPKQDQEKMLKAIEENPELFENMAKEIQVEVAGGVDQIQAALKVATKYQDQLKNALDAKK